MESSILIAISTYNEIENLPNLVSEIRQRMPTVDLLVIDDNSPDGTGQWCDRHAEVDSRFRCIHRAGKEGLGTATILGLQTAIDEGYEFVVNMDADFSHDPKYLPDLVSGMDHNSPPVDVMIGTRYAKGGGVDGWPLSRRIMSRLVNLYTRLIIGLSVSDCSGAFRCYRTGILKKIDFSNVKSTGYSFFEEILWHLKNVGARFGECPIIFVDRELGESKISLAEAVNAVRVITAVGIRARLGRRPRSRQS